MKAGTPAFHNKSFFDGAWELPGDWVESASCASSGFPDAWFPDAEDPNSVFAAAQARRICQECPVRLDCLDYAMTHEHGRFRYGVFGGLTPGQRFRLAKGSG